MLFAGFEWWQAAGGRCGICLACHNICIVCSFDACLPSMGIVSAFASPTKSQSNTERA